MIANVEDYLIKQHITSIDTIAEICAHIDNDDKHRDTRNAQFSLLISNCIDHPSRENNELLGAYLKHVCVEGARASIAAEPDYQPEDENYEEVIVMTMGDR